MNHRFVAVASHYHLLLLELLSNLKKETNRLSVAVWLTADGDPSTGAIQDFENGGDTFVATILGT